MKFSEDMARMPDRYLVSYRFAWAFLNIKFPPFYFLSTFGSSGGGGGNGTKYIVWYLKCCCEGYKRLRLTKIENFR